MGLLYFHIHTKLNSACDNIIKQVEDSSNYTRPKNYKTHAGGKCWKIQGRGGNLGLEADQEGRSFT